MRMRAPLLLSGLVALVTLAAEPTASSLKQCPSGHPTLKDVPIDPVPGGNVKSPYSPKTRVACTTCGFTYQPHDPQWSAWTRTSSDLKSFPRPFSRQVTAFPIPPAGELKNPVRYTQCLTDRLESRSGTVTYQTTRPLERVREEIQTWLEKRPIACRFHARTESPVAGRPALEVLEWDNLGYVSIEVRHDPADQLSTVRATFYTRQ